MSSLTDQLQANLALPSYLKQLQDALQTAFILNPTASSVFCSSIEADSWFDIDGDIESYLVGAPLTVIGMELTITNISNRGSYQTVRCFYYNQDGDLVSFENKLTYYSTNPCKQSHRSDRTESKVLSKDLKTFNKKQRLGTAKD